MTKSINLLKDKKELYEKKKKKKFVVRAGSLALLLVYSLGAILIFGYSLVLKKESYALSDNITKAKTEIEALGPVETKQVYLKNKAQSLTQILTSQKEHQRLVETVFNLLTQGVEVSGFNIDKEAEVSFQGKSQSLADLLNFFDELKSHYKTGDALIRIVEISEVRFNYKEGYTFNVHIIFE